MLYVCIPQAKIRKGETFAGIFAPNFKRACEFIKIAQGVSPEGLVGHFYYYIIP